MGAKQAPSVSGSRLGGDSGTCFLEGFPGGLKLLYAESRLSGWLQNDRLAGKQLIDCRSKHRQHVLRNYQSAMAVCMNEVAFADLEEAFDPAANTAYAAALLRSLFRTTGSWIYAVQKYHSGKYRNNYRYRLRVMRLWSQLRGRR